MKKKNDIKVSVWMITYNHEKYIAQALEGVLMQKTNFNFEIVIGEDASTDKTRVIIEKFEKENISIINAIYQKKNVGAMRNAYEFTLPKCKGKYIACCEGDDYWTYPYKLQKQVDFLEKNPDYGFVYSDFNMFFQETKTEIKAYNKTNQIETPIGNIYNNILHPNSWFIRTQTICFRTELLKYYHQQEVQNKKWKMGDLPLFLAISQHTKIGYIDEPLATYRILKNSACHFTDRKKSFAFTRSLFDVRKFFIEKYACPEYLKNLITLKEYDFLLREAFWNRDIKQSKIAYTYLKQNKVLKCLHIFFYLSTQNQLLNQLLRKLKNKELF